MLISKVSVIPLLIASGVLGYLSFNILTKMGKVYSSDSKEKTLSVTFLSFVNFIIYWILILVLNLFIHNLEITILVALIVTIVLSLIYPLLVPEKLFIIFNKIINGTRTKHGYSMQNSKPVRELIFDKNCKTIIYIFDFNHNLVNCGYISHINTKNSDPLEIAIIPFNQANTLKSFEAVQSYIESEDIESNIIINFELKFQMILIDI